jgi:hypothetical protein
MNQCQSTLNVMMKNSEIFEKNFLSFFLSFFLPSFLPLSSLSSCAGGFPSNLCDLWIIAALNYHKLVLNCCSPHNFLRKSKSICERTYGIISLEKGFSLLDYYNSIITRLYDRSSCASSKNGIQVNISYRCQNGAMNSQSPLSSIFSSFHVIVLS